jgi:predicted nuclease of predicted toxin-antitoxin system
MSVKILIDMNLSPDWAPVLQRHGWSAIHWSTVGDQRATDRTIMDWALANGYVEGIVIAALRQHDADLASGALVVVDEAKCRVRVLPI